DAQRQRQGVDRVERADRHDQVVAVDRWAPGVLDHALAARGSPEQGTGIGHVDLPAQAAKPRRPGWVRASDQEPAREPALDERDPVKAVREYPFEQEKLDPASRRAVAPLGAKLHVEQIVHATACAMAEDTRQGRMIMA